MSGLSSGRSIIREPKIVLLDLETLPDLKKALKYWVKLSSFPGKTLRASVSSICCIGWKILGEDETHCISAWDFPEWLIDVNNDRPVIEAFLKVIEGADAIVTHNGKNFDKKHLQTRLLLNDLTPLPDDPHIDTKSLSSRNFYFIDNKLQTLGEELFGERKLDHEGWDLWVKTHNRDPVAQETMREYCKQDVRLLEKIYRKFRPVAKNIPNYNQFEGTRGEKMCCSRCGSTRVMKNGTRRSKITVYQRLICQDCGGCDRLDLKGRDPRSV